MYKDHPNHPNENSFNTEKGFGQIGLLFNIFLYDLNADFLWLHVKRENRRCFTYLFIPHTLIAVLVIRTEAGVLIRLPISLVVILW